MASESPRSKAHDARGLPQSTGPYTAPLRARRQNLGIDAIFGGYPLNALKREQITAWVAGLTAAGKKPGNCAPQRSSGAQVLTQALADRRLHDNPADHVKLPSERSRAVVDDPAQFLTAPGSRANPATPWPYNVYVHLAAWAGLRAGELCGLQVGDVSYRSPP